MNNELGNIRILIVEDEQLTALVLKETLESMGISVVATVDSGKEAISKAEETHPDLVLMDIVIEGDLDGIETANEIYHRFDIPVVYLTAFSDEDTMQRAKSTEPFAYLIKPYNERELKFIIEMAIFKQKLEKELKESEGKYRTLFDNAGYPITYYDLDGAVILINTVGARNLGGVPDDFVGKSIYQLLPRLAEALRERIQLILQTGKGYNFEDFLELPSGKGNCWFSSNLQPVRDANGKIFAIQVISQDITERKRAEEALRKERDRAQRYLDIAGVIILAINANQEIELINQKGCHVLGYNEEEIVGKNWFDHFIPEKQRAKIKEVFVGLVEGKTEPLEYFENTILTKSGEERIIAWYNTLLKDEAGKISGTLSSGEDVTRSRKAEEAVRQSEERYRTLQENIPLGVYRSTPEGEIVSANPAMARMFGLPSVKELLKQSALDFYLIPQEREELFKQLKDEGVIAGSEVRFKRRDGSTFWGCMNFKGIYDKKGKLLHMDGIIEDITHRRKVEEEMLKTEKLESLGLLAGGIAHDFNNILAAILVNVGLARLNIKKTDKVLDRLNEMEKAVSRAKNLTQQLLTFSKGGAPIKSSVSMEQLLRETADFASSGSNVKCDFIISEDLWGVEIDEGQISQVIQNLIINADQAMPGGGVVQISAENITIGSDDEPSLKEGTYIKITIEDHGLGIPGDHLDKIFDPFFTTKQKGSGLGLSTAYSIIKNHNGLITVVSELGKGTTFCIYLPSTGEEVLEKEEIEEETVVGHGRILLMDDELEVLEATAEVLDAIGYTVETVEDGAEALKLYKKALGTAEAFDLVIMDLIIPGGMGGKEAIQEMLKIDPSVKAIVSSGYSTDPIMANYNRYGFSAALSKPFKIKELNAVLHEVLFGREEPAKDIGQ